MGYFHKSCTFSLGIAALGIALLSIALPRAASAQTVDATADTTESRNWYSPQFEVLANGTLIHFDQLSRHAIIATEEKQTIALAFDTLSLSDQKLLQPEEPPAEAEKNTALKDTTAEDTASEGTSAENIAAEKIPEEAKPEIYSGKVIRVIAGDLLTMQVDKKRLAIALDGIDAPEKQQPYSKISRVHLWKLIGRKQAVAIVRGRDEKERYICALFCEGKYLNREMLQTGLAWVAQDNVDPSLLSLQTEAQTEKLGLWADEKVLAPWEWLEMSHVERTLAIKERKAPKAAPEVPSLPTAPTSNKNLSYWLNTYSNVRHNNKCEWFGKTSRGRECTANEGKPCGACGG